jgi:hypothetical protein
MLQSGLLQELIVELPTPLDTDSRQSGQFPERSDAGSLARGIVQHPRKHCPVWIGTGVQLTPDSPLTG